MILALEFEMEVIPHPCRQQKASDWVLHHMPSFSMKATSCASAEKGAFAAPFFTFAVEVHQKERRRFEFRMQKAAAIVFVEFGE